MTTIEQPSLLTAAYAAGVLMFFAPCSVGLLPAYLTYYFTNDSAQVGTENTVSGPTKSKSKITLPSESRDLARQLLLGNGILLFFMGAIPLFYMATAGIRVLLPGYHFVVPLAKLGTGSYLPPVTAVFVGTILSVVGSGRSSAFRGLRIGTVATFGIVLLYLLVGGVVLIVGQWIQPYVASLELLVGPLIVVLGVAYYRGISPLRPIKLPQRGEVSNSEFFTFGVFYGIGSLACNLPIFLGIVLSSFFTAGLLSGLAVFVAFAAGMGTLMIGLSVVASLSKGSLSLGQHAACARTLGSSAFVLIGLHVTWFTLRSFGYISVGELF
ncbi:Cytochrome c biogenesis protein CcdA [Haladaptatus litoreus]|uniref:Cytochrome c biogenesis protein CcdA n=1 Tax=Haladaptatus litoreus TaxID=553468 RepID=A0A1N7EUB5_9EURY|nr:integral membrane transporter [Haladaptatus litoreus]SIR91690.1 Cytochrome c biogenesis protein CcdA [Haladaptatus litoreus]